MCKAGHTGFSLRLVARFISGYVAQFIRFGVGHPLASAVEIADIPELLDRAPARQVPLGKQAQSDGTNRLNEAFAISESNQVATLC